MLLELWQKFSGKQNSATILNKTLTLRRQIRKTSRTKCRLYESSPPSKPLTNMKRKIINMAKSVNQAPTYATNTICKTKSQKPQKIITKTTQTQILTQVSVNKLNKNKCNKINPSNRSTKENRKITKCYLNHNQRRNMGKCNLSPRKSPLTSSLCTRKSYKKATIFKGWKIICYSHMYRFSRTVNKQNVKNHKNQCFSNTSRNRIKITENRIVSQQNEIPCGNLISLNKSVKRTEIKTTSSEESICDISTQNLINNAVAGESTITPPVCTSEIKKKERIWFYSKLWDFSALALNQLWQRRLHCSSTVSCNPRNGMLRGFFLTFIAFVAISNFNVLQTSAASVQISNVAIASVTDLQEMSSSTPTSPTTKTTTSFELARNHKTKDQELLNTTTTEQQDDLPQSSSVLPQHNVYDREVSEGEQENMPNITSVQTQDSALLRAKQKRGQQLQQYLTSTQETSFNANGLPHEPVDRKTLESLSIAEGGLMLPMDILRKAQQEKKQREDGDYDHNKKIGSSDGDSMSLDEFPFQKRQAMPVFDFSLPQNITARSGLMEAAIKCRVDRIGDKSVSWIRKRDLHIISVGKTTYTSDKRFHVTESKDTREWILHVRSPQARDSGIYECQVNTEPKMSMAFQLNIIEISPNSNAIITGPTDLYVKVGSVITLTCLVRQPSIKDIGPIHWYRSEHLLTPYGMRDEKIQENYFVTAAALTSKSNSIDHNIDTDMYDSNADEEENVSQNLMEEITQDFRQRVAMEQQLCDTIKSRLRISNAQKSDSGNYTCQPTTARSASVMVHVINEENPAAMQKSGAARPCHL